MYYKTCKTQNVPRDSVRQYFSEAIDPYKKQRIAIQEINIVQGTSGYLCFQETDFENSTQNVVLSGRYGDQSFSSMQLQSLS